MEHGDVDYSVHLFIRFSLRSQVVIVSGDVCLNSLIMSFAVSILIAKSVCPSVRSISRAKINSLARARSLRLRSSAGGITATGEHFRFVA